MNKEKQEETQAQFQNLNTKKLEIGSQNNNR